MFDIDGAEQRKKSYLLFIYFLFKKNKKRCSKHSMGDPLIINFMISYL